MTFWSCSRIASFAGGSESEAHEEVHQEGGGQGAGDGGEGAGGVDLGQGVAQRVAQEQELLELLCMLLQLHQVLQGPDVLVVTTVHTTHLSLAVAQERSATRLPRRKTQATSHRCYKRCS